MPTLIGGWFMAWDAPCHLAGQAALGGVYKLVAVEKGGEWVPAMKISESPEKTTNPGEKVWRLYDQRGRATTDLLGLHRVSTRSTRYPLAPHDPVNHMRFRGLEGGEVSEAVTPPGQRAADQGRLVYQSAHHRADASGA